MILFVCLFVGFFFLRFFSVFLHLNILSTVLYVEYSRKCVSLGVVLLLVIFDHNRSHVVSTLSVCARSPLGGEFHFIVFGCLKCSNAKAPVYTLLFHWNLQSFIAPCFFAVWVMTLLENTLCATSVRYHYHHSH